MVTNPSVFKAYDIRGVYGTDFDEDLAYRLGLAFAGWRLKNSGQDRIKLVAASDMRLSSPSLKVALLKGLTEGGADVIDIGLASTPTFYFAVAHYGADGGITVSASHNPKEHNGFKLVRERAMPVGQETGLTELQALVFGTDLQPVKTPGLVEMKEKVVYDQAEHDFKYFDLTKIKPLKIVVDTANGMGSTYLDEFFRRLPQVELVRLNWNLDGTFPAHPADPFQPANVKQSSEAVVANKADLGMTTDGDADRIFFVDETGAAVAAGITRAILAKLFLADKPGAKIGYDIRPGRITPDTIIANGGTPVITRVGHSLIKAQMLKDGIYFAGESSGHFFLSMEEGCYEVPMVVAGKLLVSLSDSGQKFSEYLKPYQKYFSSGEINSTVADSELKMNQVKKH